MTSDSLGFTVSHRGKVYSLSLPPDTPKLIYKGKKPSPKGDETIAEAGLKNGLKVQMLGSTVEELGELKQVENEHQRRERIMKERALKPQAKSARKLLTRLAEDPAIRHVMQKHQFTVGTLTELAPHEQPHLLGLNVNGGQAIKLRLRTNDYEGFRTYKEVRRVLCHELTHNVWGDHDNNFKELNSQLNREVAEFERAATAGAHQLYDTSGAYTPGSELERDAQILGGGGAYVLGGASSEAAQDSREERRRKMLEATLSRLKKEEEELEQSCGTAGPSASSH